MASAHEPRGEPGALTRRGLLAAGAGAPLAALLAGCTTGGAATSAPGTGQTTVTVTGTASGVPSSAALSPAPGWPAPLPSSGARITPERCVQLEGHTFQRLQRFCSATPPIADYVDVVPIDYLAPCW